MTHKHSGSGVGAPLGSKSVRSVIAGAIALAALAACSKGANDGGGAPSGSGGAGGGAKLDGGQIPIAGSSGASGGGGGGGASGAAGDNGSALGGAGAAVDASTTITPKSCGTLRECISKCTTDAACKQHCRDTAPAEAKTAYALVETCSLKSCPDGDEVCRCQAECIGGGECTDVVDTCRALDDDTFCDVTCH